ncbi:MAG: hypothetical protein DHS20C13_02740 [Thermodesulfobacteriota bacterium]|nr:MAG: hypothetical protein DHS20C13_02740 [Thermodesulfobacteriota bacterium]
MVTNIRDEIDKALAEKLKSSSLIQRVSREFVAVDLETGTIEEISHLEMPALVVNSGNEAGFVETAGGSTRVNYSPEIVGYVYDEDEYFSELNKLIAETKKILFADRRIIYNSQSIGTINGITSINTDRGRLAPYGAFSMALDVLFDYKTSTGGEL